MIKGARNHRMSKSKNKILIVEDDQKITLLLKDYLEQEGFKVTTLHRGEEVLMELRANPADLILLDILLPGESGLTVIEKTRAVSKIPIIFLTAKVEDSDRLLGLELGADDCICKPFLPEEVVARVKAVLRRACFHHVGNKLVAGPIVVNSTNYNACINEKDLHLTRIEFDLLKLMVSRPDQVFTRSDLIEKVKRSNFEVYDRTIDSHICNLRKKIGQLLPRQKIIHTVYGIGYSFSTPK